MNKQYWYSLTITLLIYCQSQKKEYTKCNIKHCLLEIENNSLTAFGFNGLSKFWILNQPASIFMLKIEKKKPLQHINNAIGKSHYMGPMH